MSITETHPAPRRVSRPAQVWVRCALLLVWVTLALTAVLSGERQGRFTNLQDALAQGAITEVTVRGEGLPEDTSGYTTQTVVWQDSWTLTRQDEIRLIVGRENGDGNRFAGPVLAGEGDLGAYLQRTYPGVSVNQEAAPRSESNLLGFHHLPSWIGLIQLLLSLTVLLWIVLVPKPWRMTRWGWFWVLLMLSPVATPLFLLLSGPVPFVPAPKDVQRRISGGWAFLLCLFLSGVVPVTWAARNW